VNGGTYDRIGIDYSKARQADPRIAARIDAALGDAGTVVNVGAGTGSYEPTDRGVTAVEPSAEMIAQRPSGSAVVVQAGAEALPFDEDSFDAAMAILTIHHWTDLDAGLAEMQRVARRRIVIVTFDPEPLRDLWIVRDYFPGMLHLESDRTSGHRLAAELPEGKSIPLPVPRDCSDRFFAALWDRPELLLDDEIVGPMWVWSRLSDEERQEGRAKLSEDLRSGRWQERYSDLQTAPELDVGLRLVISELRK
jgi:ubiquinone/menaquinone biosynthesis C-methylase UbiE